MLDFVVLFVYFLCFVCNGLSFWAFNVSQVQPFAFCTGSQLKLMDGCCMLYGCSCCSFLFLLSLASSLDVQCSILRI